MKLDSRRADGLWLAGILLVLVPMRVSAAVHAKEMKIDGGYYLDVARHVRDGLGLTTQVSLYHAGMEHFPSPTSVYPLWPWLLGMLAKVAPLESLAHGLPLVLYVLSLFAAWGLGRALWPDSLFGERLPGLHGGHILAVLLGLHAEYMAYSVIPYTESLCWLLLCMFLWRLVVVAGRPAFGTGLELGVGMALLYFARSQMLVVPIALGAASACSIVAGPDRRGRLLQALGAFGVLGAALFVWSLHLRTFLPHAGLESLLRFDQNRDNDLLSPLAVLAPSTSVGDFLSAQLEGLSVAFSLDDDKAYGSAFYTIQYALPLALPLWLMASARWLRREGWSGLRRWAGGPEAWVWMTLGLFAAGGVLSIHLAHKLYNGEWYFHRRQALVCLPAFYFALMTLLRSKRGLLVGVGVFLLSAFVEDGVREAWKQAVHRDRGGVEDHALATWLEARAVHEPNLVVALAGDDVQRTAWQTTHIGYQWFCDQTPYADLLTMTDRLGARYVIYKDDETRSWRFRRGAGAKPLDQDFRKLDEQPNGFTVLERRSP